MSSKAFKNKSRRRKSRHAEHETYAAEMSEYRSIARYITQIAFSALILPILFIENFVTIKEGVSIANVLNPEIKASWALLFISIGSGIWYQYVATKKIVEGKKSKKPWFPRFFFTVTMLCFYVGILLFLLGVIDKV